MDVRRVGEALLRSHPTNLFSAVSRPSQQQSRLLSNRNVSRHISQTSRRTFTSSTSRPQQSAPKEDDSAPQQTSQASPSPSGQQEPRQQSGRVANPLKFGSILGSALSQSGPNSGTAQSTESSNSGSDQPTRRPLGLNIRNLQQRMGGRSSLDDASMQRADAAAAAARSQAAGSSSTKATALANLRNMLNNTVLRPGREPQRAAAWHMPLDSGVSVAPRISLMEPPEPEMLPRLGPSYGRTVSVVNNDLVGALRRMDRRIAANNIRKSYHSQKFHERPGLKRKRLASARWRARFQKAFQATVATVKHLKKQGW